MQKVQKLMRADWLYQYKKKIIVGILLILAVSIVLTMASIAVTLKNRLIAESKARTGELGEVIRLSLSHLMLQRNPENIQTALEIISRGDSSMVRASILDRNGNVAYSSNRREIGTSIDRFREKSCSGCHTGQGMVPQETTMIIRIDDEVVLRNVTIFYNEKPCHACHAPSVRVNGKLIIDRSVQSTDVLISKVEIILAISGMLCLVVLVPFLSRILSRGLDKYINEILLKSTELSLLYHVVERLSNTIEMDELKPIVVKIVREALSADEIHIIMPKDSHEHSGIVWRKSDDKTDRRMAGDDAPYLEVISAWQNKELNAAKVSDDHKEVYLPIIKNDDRLALIIVRRNDDIFNAFGMSMVKAMGNHIAVAFENALLYQIAITDELTGLYSKRHFLSSIEKRFALYERYGEKLTLLMLDIDDFKKINDTYGHPAGDHVLKQIGQTVMNSTRGGDMDFRYGGEEFVVILPATDSAWGVFVAERIRKKIEDMESTVENVIVKLTVSIGVASCPEHAVTIKDLIVKADRSLYEAKRTGKNKVVMSMEKSAL